MEERERLILDHMKQVRMIAHQIHKNLPSTVLLEDLVSTGMLGLIAAVDHFEPGHAATLKTYAEYKIRSAILDSLRHNAQSTRGQRRRSKLIANAQASVADRLHRAATEDELAGELGITLKEYHRWLVPLIAVSVGEVDIDELLNYCPADPERQPDRLYARAELLSNLHKAFDKLPAGERAAVDLYFLEELDLLEITPILRVCASRVSQLKRQGTARLRKLLGYLKPGPGSG